ncbi:MAG: alpha/beta hydrolase [Candidatus Bathyarchaeia archaeon]
MPFTKKLFSEEAVRLPESLAKAGLLRKIGKIVISANFYLQVTLGPRMPNIKVGDVTFHLEESGKGNHLILLHGLLRSIESDWKRFIPSFSREYRVIAVDMRGHGLTDNNLMVSYQTSFL